MIDQRDQLHILIDQLSEEDVARALGYAQQLAITAEKVARGEHCWSCGTPRDYSTQPLCLYCFASDRRQL